MEFQYAELKWEYGYFMIIGFMFLLILGMAYYFKRRSGSN
jgi:magnesium transporter